MKKNCIMTVAFLLTTILNPLMISATNYYVDNNHPAANDNNQGTLSSPWKTMQHAVETVVAGDTVFIRTGVYSEQVFTENDGNISDGYIVFSAYPGEKPVLDGTGVTTGNTGLFINHSYMKFIGLEIRNWEDNAIWMENCGYVELSDCEIHDVFYGIGVADGAHDFVLNRVEMHHFSLYGFDATASGGADCYNGTFNDCIAHTGRDQTQNVDGFALGHGTQHDFVFNRCTVYNIYDGFDISSRNTTLNRCLAYDCWNGGYKLWQDEIKLINCIGYNNTVSNVELDWDEEPGRTTMVNCTFYNAGTFTIWIENAADTLHLYNCILAGGQNIALTFEQMGIGNYHGDYNLFHNNDPNRVIAVGYTDEFSLDQLNTGFWTTYSGQDAHSVVANSAAEIFVNPANNDFHLSVNSRAIDRGTVTGAPSGDYDGISRPVGAGFDIGAYEYHTEIGVIDIQSEEYFPETLSLFQNFPNPFNAITNIPYVTPVDGNVKLEIYNLNGRKIRTLVNQIQQKGRYTFYWDARDQSGIDIASGVYLCHLRVNQTIQTKKMILLR